VKNQLDSLNLFLSNYEMEYSVNGHWSQMGVVTITPNYDNTEVSTQEKLPLENGTAAPLVYAQAEVLGLGYTGRANQAISSWCSSNTGYGNLEGALTLVYKGQRIFEAAAMCGCDVSVWAVNTYLPACDAIINARNWGSRGNWGAWGRLGRMMVYAYLGMLANLTTEGDGFVTHLQNSTKRFWFVEEGDLWTEAYRNNYCMSYMSFYITPTLRAAMMHEILAEKLYPVIRKYWYYCKDQNWPKRFPYKKLWGPLGWLQQRIWSAGSDFHIPTSNNWAGSLFRTAGLFYNMDEWKSWSPDCATTETTLFRYPDIFWSTYKLGK